MTAIPKPPLELATRADDPSATVGQVRQRSIVVTELREKLRREAPELASLVTVRAVPTRDIQGMLGTEEALLEYFQAGGDLFVFVLTRTAVHALRLPGEHLDVEVSRLRRALEDPAQHDHEPLSARLYERLVRPLEDHLAVQHLIVVPHGSLHYLPFNVLRGPRGAVIDRWTVRYLPSASVMKYLAERAASGEAVLAIGNPDLGQPGLQLRYAGEEATRIGGHVPGSRVLLGGAATETAFRELAPRYRYLHLASHGRFDAKAPLTSGLYLARDALHDGVLTVEEIYSLRLNASLATLSACETALGTLSAGDDIVGLTRGLLYAGARSVVASLWRVDDEATLRLMTEFYAGLETRGKAEALRRAQLATRRRYAHPFYWAAFQLTGAAR